MSHHQPVSPNSGEGATIHGWAPSQPNSRASMDLASIVTPNGVNSRMSCRLPAPNSRSVRRSRDWEWRTDTARAANIKAAPIAVSTGTAIARAR